MKKILLILISLLLCGCYDYNELADIGIVTTMFVEYEDDKYVIHLEVLDSNKNTNEASFFLNGTGYTIEDALNDIYSKSTTHIYLSHMNAVTLAKDVAREKLDEIYDYFIREIDIRKDFYVLISEHPSDFFELKTQSNKSVGESIKNIMGDNLFGPKEINSCSFLSGIDENSCPKS